METRNFPSLHQRTSPLTVHQKIPSQRFDIRQVKSRYNSQIPRYNASPRPSHRRRLGLGHHVDRHLGHVGVAVGAALCRSARWCAQDTFAQVDDDVTERVSFPPLRVGKSTAEGPLASHERTRTPKGEDESRLEEKGEILSEIREPERKGGQDPGPMSLRF